MTLRPAVWISALLVTVILASAVTADAQRRRRRRARGPATLIIRTDVEGAEVIIDEETVGFTPVDPQTLEPGQHTVRVRRPGFTEFDDVVSLEAGQESTLDVPLIALAMIVTVRSTPDEARVFVDGTFRGNTPIELELADGDHSLRVVAPLYQEEIREVTARAGETDLFEFELERIPEELLNPPDPEWYEEPLPWILVGAGALVVAAAIVVITYFATQTQPIEDHCGVMDNPCIELTVMEPPWRFP